ncbi:MAG: ATP-dependent sacrificial sulfur transferase LarE [Huintestinicola sp.]
MELKEFFSKYPKAAVCFSGGCDSAYLTYAALKQGAEIHAYYVKTQFQPTFELCDAKRLSEELGFPLTVINADILSEKAVTDNPCDRCYRCKKIIFSIIKKAAVSDGFDILLDGTNASDDISDRPGTKAAEELNVMSPLRICGLTKPMIRELSKKAGLFTWDKPAYACLATRISHGEEITADKLEAAEKSETFLFTLGFRDFRVRISGKNAKIQIHKEQLPLFEDKEELIKEELSKYFDYIELDREVSR